MYKKRLRICYLCLLTMIIFIMIIALKVEGNIVQAYTKLQGEGTIDRPFLIQNEEDYVEFAKAVSEEKNHYTNQFVRITADLDFSKINMTVGVNDDHETYFSGVLDGMGHKISNVYLNQGDGPSGLFLNLNGLITNLQVENGIISGTSAGGIVGSVHDSGKVLNCCNKATVIGDTEDGIVGEFIGQVENCYGIDMILNDEEAGFENYETEENGEENNDEQLQKYVDKLNANLDMLSVNEEYHNWCRWEVREGEISLTESMEHVVNAIKTEIHMNENIITLKAFSGNDGNWYFALPSGYQKDESLTVTLVFQNGEILKSHVESEETELSVSYQNKIYRIIFKSNENTASIFMTTEVAQGVRYLADTKENITRGNITVFDENGSLHYSGVVNELSGRGNDSYIRSSKKGYNVTLKERVNLLNLGVDEDFVLLSGYRDNSLLSYKVTQDMEKETEIKYAPYSCFVNLYMNNQYLGLYFLTEKIEIDQNRYNISDMKDKTQQLSNMQLSSYSMESGNTFF